MGLSLPAIVRFRKKNSIKSFLPQHGTKRKIIDGVEHKWCPRGNGHWESLMGFKTVPTRAGGFAGICQEHLREDARGRYHNSGGLEQARRWRKTENGKSCLRNTWRKEKAKKDNAYVRWNQEDENRVYAIFEGRCAYCGVQIEFLKVEFDHVVPITSGGKTEPSNMVSCCKKCNHGVGGKFNRDAIEWLTCRFGEERATWIYNNIQNKIGIITENPNDLHL